jgi:hypothetical protein
MNERIDLHTAMRVDLTLILLPAIGWIEAAVALAENDVPLEVAARVLALPMERRGHRQNLYAPASSKSYFCRKTLHPTHVKS